MKKIRILPLNIALVLIALASPTAVRADAVTDWNAIAATSIMSTAGQPPHVAPLSLAMEQGAVYDAVNAIERGHQPHLVQPPSNPTDSKEAATATAAFRVLVGFADLPGLFPTQLPTLQPIYDAYIANLPDNPPGSRAAGIVIGEATARAMLIDRQNDGRFGPPSTLYPPAPGIWRPTPPNFGLDPAAWVGNVRPFIVPSAEMLRTDGPNALTSDAYAQDFNEIKELGSLTSTTRTADQTAAAIFWQDSGPAIWNRVYRALATSRGLNIVESARLFAMTNLAGADGSIGCWNDKYYWQFWRPITAIRGGRHRRQPGDRGRPKLAAALQPNRSSLRSAPRHAALPRTTRRVTPPSAARPCTRCRPSSAPTGSPSRRSAISAFPRPVRRGASIASPMRSRRSSTRASGAGSTSAPPTCKGQSSARRSPATSRSTTSSRSDDTDDGHHFKTNTEIQTANNNPASTRKKTHDNKTLLQIYCASCFASRFNHVHYRRCASLFD
jgi:hypothetical protein